MIVIFRSIIIFSRFRTPISPIGNESSNLSGDVLFRLSTKQSNFRKEKYYVYRNRSS